MKDKAKYFILVIISALLAGGAIGLNVNTVGVFLKPVAENLGFLQGDFAFHATLISLGIAFSSFVIPVIINRYPFRLVILIATIAVVLTTIGMSMSNELWQFHVLGFLRGVFSSFYGIVAISLLLNNWYHKNHGLVTSIVFSFTGVIGAVFSPVLAQIISNSGWRSGFVYQALFFALLSLPAILIPFKLRPEMEGRLPYGVSLEEDAPKAGISGKSAVSAPSSKLAVAVITITVVAVLVTSLTGLGQHFNSIGLDYGFTPTISALMLSLCMLGNIISKLFIGVLSDRKNAVVASITMTSITTLGLILILAGSNETIVLLGSFLFGAIYSFVTVGVPLLILYICGAKNFSKIFPMVHLMANVGAALAISIYGYSYDLTRSYNLALIVSITVALLAIVLVLFINRYKQHTIILSTLKSDRGQEPA